MRIFGPEHQPGDGDRRQEVVDTGVGRRRHRGVVLGPEVLHDHFLDVPELLVRAANRVHRLGALGQRLADADQQAGGERDRQPARVVQRAQPNRRDPCRGCRSAPGPSVSNSRRDVVSSIMPIDGATGLSRDSSDQLITPGFRCGSRPVSSSTRIAIART